MTQPACGIPSPYPSPSTPSIGTIMPERHLIILGIRGVPAAHGGFESFAERFAPFMVRNGWKVTVYCQGSNTGKRYEDTWEGCRRVHIPVGGDGPLATIDFDIKSTIEAVREKGILLTLGYNTGFLSVYARIRGRFNLINMDGIEWRRAKYSKLQQAYLWLNEKLATASGNVLIADHPEIARHHSAHASPGKIEMIPYGGDLIDSADEELLKTYGLERDHFLTVIARPEPENSLLEIVQAFSRRPRGVKLVVLGKYDREHTYQSSVLNAASDEVLFPGAIYDKQALSALRFYSLAYVHGHQVGGTNPSLVEALGAGNAIIAHDNPFNRWVAGDAGCYFANTDECEARIMELIGDTPRRDEMKRHSRQRWTKAFTWEKILGDYKASIEKYAC
jgi:glycosyltransferase involved in cell wall biosynthesis